MRLLAFRLLLSLAMAGFPGTLWAQQELPAIERLGVAEDVKVGDDEYDHLFVVTIGIDGVRLLRLTY
jgi:hypothetical protein